MDNSGRAFEIKLVAKGGAAPVEESCYRPYVKAGEDPIRKLSVTPKVTGFKSEMSDTDSMKLVISDAYGSYFLRSGDASSNPWNGGHESLKYKDKDEKWVFIDCEGMFSSTSCEEHGCLNRIISLKED